MAIIIQFPKTPRVENFYRFIVRWTDGDQFTGNSLEECFRKQKDRFEPEFSMAEYLERFRKRLEIVTGVYYDYRDVKGLVAVLTENGFLEVIRKDVPNEEKKSNSGS